VSKKIGLVCGLGGISKIAEGLARNAGYEPVTVKLDKFRALASLVFKRGRAPIRPIEIMEFFKEQGINRIAIVGKFPKAIMFLSFAGDEPASKVSGEADKKDVNIYRIIRRELEARGFELVPQVELLRPILAPNDGSWGPEPSEEVLGDLEKGLELARTIAQAGAGQACVVKQGAAIALEAFEHTDSMIKRAAKLSKGGYVVVKVPWPGESVFDLPTIGTKTVRLVRKTGGRAIGVVGGKTVLITPERLKALCDDFGVTLYFFSAH